jgi:hypothetical protein
MVPLARWFNIIPVSPSNLEHNLELVRVPCIGSLWICADNQLLRHVELFVVFFCIHSLYVRTQIKRMFLIKMCCHQACMVRR